MKVYRAFLYNDPLSIIDSQRAITARKEKQRTVEPVRKPKDRYYTQAGAIHISSLVAFRKKYGGTWEI
jgi:hypothetical protein